MPLMKPFLVSTVYILDKKVPAIEYEYGRTSESGCSVSKWADMFENGHFNQSEQYFAVKDNSFSLDKIS